MEYESRTLCETFFAHLDHRPTISTSPSVSATGGLTFLFESHRYDVSNAKLRGAGRPTVSIRSDSLDPNLCEVSVLEQRSDFEDEMNRK